MSFNPNTLITKLDPFLFAHVLCFKEWTDPEDFYKLTYKQRRLLMMKYKPLAVAPSETNYWIWFGTYVTKGNYHTPRFNNESVSRTIFQALNGSLDGGNLRSVFTLTNSDVNPHKFMRSTGLSRLKQQEIMLASGGASVKEMAEKKFDHRMEAEVAKMTRFIEENFDETMGFTKSDFRTMAQQAAIAPGLAIELALERTDKPFAPEPDTTA